MNLSPVKYCRKKRSRLGGMKAMYWHAGAAGVVAVLSGQPVVTAGNFSLIALFTVKICAAFAALKGVDVPAETVHSIETMVLGRILGNPWPFLSMTSAPARNSKPATSLVRFEAELVVVNAFVSGVRTPASPAELPGAVRLRILGFTHPQNRQFSGSEGSHFFSGAVKSKSMKYPC